MYKVRPSAFRKQDIEHLLSKAW